MHQNLYILEAEIIELNSKPALPFGERGFNQVQTDRTARYNDRDDWNNVSEMRLKYQSKKSDYDEQADNKNNAHCTT